MNTVSERDLRLNKLPSSQKEFLLDYINKGKQKVFSKIISTQKGVELATNFSLDDAERNVQEWELIQVIDSGFVNEKIRCECGRPLRYQYIVQHKTTKKVLKFGINHFEEHMGLPSKIVDEIRKGFNKIDLDVNELLEKLENNVNHQNLISHWPEDLPIPEDIKNQLDAGIPLLDRQIKTLQNLKNDYFINQTFVIDEARKAISQYQIAEEEFNLFTMDDKLDETYIEITSELLEPLVIGLVQKGIFGVMEICDILIDEFDIETELYKTGRPKLLVKVINILDKLVEQGELLLTEDSTIENRYYAPVKQ